MRRTSCLFSVVAVLATAALVLSSAPVYADDVKFLKDKVCKPATKTVGGTPDDPEAKLAPAPEKPAKEAGAESAKPGAKEPVKLDPAPATKARPAPEPASEKKEPAAAGALVVKAKPAEKPEPKPAPAATPKPDDPKKPETPVEPKGGDDDLVSVRPGDMAAAGEAAANHGFEAGYTKGHADGVVAAGKKYRIMSREEVIKIGLEAAKQAIERRLGPRPEKKAP